jgi:Zn-finger in ubiquitin-hydrolases and other protein
VQPWRGRCSERHVDRVAEREPTASFHGITVVIADDLPVPHIGSDADPSHLSTSRDFDRAYPALVAAPCEHVEEVRDDWAPVADPVCEDCAQTGDSWVSLRRCLTCGHVGCCDSSPNRHATAHHHETGHPIVRTLQPRQDWVWCYVDEITLRHLDRRWAEIDLFDEAGLGYMRDHVDAGGDPNVDEGFIFGRGFPLGRWVAEMRRRGAAGVLSADQSAQIDAFPGWRWNG